MKRIFTLAVVFSFVSMSFGQHLLLDNVRSGHNDDQSQVYTGKTDTQTAKPSTRNPEEGPDLTISFEGFVGQYYTVPLTQATFSTKTMVTNIGDELTEETDANLTVGSEYDENVAITVPMGTGDTEDLFFPTYTATETGDVTFVATANASDDADPDNGVAEKDLTIDDEILSRNNGDYIGNMSIGAPGGILGGIYEVNATDVLSGIQFYLAGATVGDIHQVVVYNFDGQPTTLIATAIDLLITEQNTTYVATFAEEVTLEPGTYFFGIVEGAHAVQLGFTSDEYVPETAWVYYNGSWQPVENYQFYQTYMMEGIFGEWEAPLFDVSLEEITMPAYIQPGMVDVTGIIRNLSGEVLTSIDVTYTMDGGDPVTETFNVNVDPLGTYAFSFADEVDLSAYGAYEFVVTISNPNGMEDEDPDNDVLTHTVNVIESIPTKRVVGEEATGTWCQWCPRGAVYMEQMAEDYPETWIGIAVHNGDPMTNTTYDAGIGPLIPGYPSGLVDRMGAIDPSQFPAAYNAQINVIPPAEIYLEDATISGNSLTFTVSADFVAEVSNFRFNAVIIEDWVTGTTSGYNQSNAYSGGNNGPMGGYEDLPNPVPASQMIYQNVARAILGGWNGQAGSLPETVYAGETHSYEFSTTLNSNWDQENLYIIGMLINQTTGQIENAVRSVYTVGISDQVADSPISVYPNPAVDFINIETPAADRIELINFMGQVVYSTEKVSSKNQINVKGFDAGIYFVRVTENGRQSTRKIVVK